MRIVHVVESLEVGGAEHMVVGLARLQRSRGHQVSIACLFREGPLAARARESGIDVLDFAKRGGMDIGVLFRLRAWLRGIQPDVLHTHNAVAHYYAVAASLGLRIGCVINTRHGMGSAGGGGRSETLFRFAMRFTDVTVAVCEAARKKFVGSGVISASKAVSIPNGIDLSRFEHRSEVAKRHLLSSLSLPGSPFVFGSVGRLNTLKDQVTMLRAFALLLQRVGNATGVSAPAAILVIAGGGEEQPALERERNRLGLDAHVFLLGERDDIPQILAGFDAFLLSSLTEGYSLVLVEAAATCLPIVATDVGGTAEIVRHEETGFLVPPRLPEVMADAMVRLFPDAQVRMQMGKAGGRWADEYGSIELMYERYMSLYLGRGVEAAMIETGAHR